MRGLKVMFLREKKEFEITRFERICRFIATLCILVQILISLFYLRKNYDIDVNFFACSVVLCLVFAICLIVSNINYNKEKFYFIFVYLPLVIFIITINLALYERDIEPYIYEIFYFYLILGVVIMAINTSINRFFFSSGKLEKTEITEKSISNWENSKSSDKVENQKAEAGGKYVDNGKKKNYKYSLKELTIDEISSEFAVDVISVTLFLGIILGLFAYLFFVPNKDISLFFGGIDIKTVALATAGLVTFFWAAKAAKNKSIELEEKKQDGKRRDKEIKMAEARDTAQLIAKASELLGSENDAQKYAGLAFLNTVASQKGGPLQKEAFDLLADFILSASDTTTSNKPRMRAITYVDKLLEDILPDYQIKAFIEISSEDATDYFNHMLNLDNYVFKKLTVVYIGFAVYFRFIDKVNELKIDKRIVLSDCKVFGKRRNGNILDLTGIALLNSTVYCCKIKEIPTSDSIDFYDKEAAEWNSKDDINKFVFCDFSDCVNWEDALSVVIANKNDIFDGCFYYAGHAPDGFDEEGEGALLTKITSEQQFDELLGDDPICMKYSPPDDKKTSNE